jgi:HEAT repeat protein
MKPSSTTLAFLLTLVPLSSHALAQAPAKPVVKGANTYATGSSRSEKAQETPRAMIERAAFLEEHERDFEAAAKLYEQAASAAQTAGDEKTATEARAAQARVQTRLGKPEVIDRRSPSGTDERIVNRIRQLFVELSQTDANTDRVTNDLKQFGAPVIHLAKDALSGQVLNLDAAGRVTIGTYKAASVLAAMSEPEAMQALAEALDSPDPVTRRLVVSVIGPEKHRALLEKAAADPVPSVRDTALQHLSQSRDPSLVKLMETAAAAKSAIAIQWMAKVAPQRLIDLAFGPGTDDELKSAAVNELQNAPDLPTDPRLVQTMLMMCRASKDDNVRREMPERMARLFQRAWAGAPLSFRQEIEHEVLAHYADFSFPGVLRLLATTGGIETIQFLIDTYASKLGDLDQETMNRLSSVFQGARSRLYAQDFDALAGTFRKLKPPGTEGRAINNYPAIREELIAALDLMAGWKTPVASIAAGFEGLDAEQKQNYARAILSWIQKCWDTSTQQFLPGTVDVRLAPILHELLRRQSNDSYVLEYVRAVGDVGLLPDLLAFWKNQKNSQVRLAIAALVQRDRATALKTVEESIARTLESSGPNAVRPVADLLSLPPPEALELFARLWPRATTDKLKDEFLFTLLEIPGTAATAALFDHYADIREPSNQGRAIERFANELYEPAIPLIGEALKSRNDSVRLASREALKKFKEQREALEEFSAWMTADKDARASVAELAKLLESNNKDVVIGAVRALAAVKARSALPALVKLLDRPDPELKKAVEEAIAKIGG